jgi:hypothetical protein
MQTASLIRSDTMGYAPETGYESAIAQNNVRRGPLRFEEGVATDTDIPYEFGRGAYGDTQGDGRGRPFTTVKSPQETEQERVHVGSASWIEAPAELSEFVQGAMADHPSFERVQGSETRILRYNATVVSD